MSEQVVRLRHEWTLIAKGAGCDIIFEENLEVPV